ncbi:threonine--tRNA ligase [bacterium]|nr:threonine--tRNA ligase [bacterium]
MPDGSIKEFTFDEEEGKEIYRHSTAHLLAHAVKQIFPDVKLGIGPATEDGFFYDFLKETPFTQEDLVKIEEKMRELAKANIPIVRKEMRKEEARRLFEQRGETLKLELIDEIEGETVTVYEQGDFFDLCRGPHLANTSYINPEGFKLLSISSAYWKGEEGNPSLQRIKGTSFPTKEQLMDYLHFLEEAEKRDHRTLGRILELFSIEEEAGAGLVFWHPRGAIVRKLIEDFWKEEHIKRGYQLVYTPHIARADLWRISGHLEMYKENMYPPMQFEGSEYILKPMNCPFHILIYKSKQRSYRELPIKYAELGTVYRYERSGVLHGLLRVRGFTQDDAHIFCTPDGLKKEIEEVLELAHYMMGKFGFDELVHKLSTRPEKFAGTLEVWEMAEGILRTVLEERGIDYIVDEGGGVFYGPKIDISLKDSLGRLWQGPTIQVDFNLPQRFNITYIGADGKEHIAVMVHRAVLGSLERFMGTLIEHHAGAFPLWLAPIQVVVLPIAERHIDYANRVVERLREAGFRVELDARNETLNYRIREAQVLKIPYILVVGDRESANGTVAPRKRGGEILPAMKLEDFIINLTKERETDNISI